jgi:hypothetical protein
MRFTNVVITALLLACLSVTGIAQTSQPAYIVAFGPGFSEATDPHYAMTGTFGIAIADGMYNLTSVDMSTRVVPGTNKRVAFSTVRTGAEKVIVTAGPLTISAHMDGGLSLGNGSAVGLVSGGGTLAYNLPRHPNLFVYGTYRAIHSPQADASAGAVQSAVSIGIGLKLFK